MLNSLGLLEENIDMFHSTSYMIMLAVYILVWDFMRCKGVSIVWNGARHIL